MVILDEEECSDRECAGVGGDKDFGGDEPPLALLAEADPTITVGDGGGGSIAEDNEGDL